jgi:hypothetical protein
MKMGSLREKAQFLCKKPDVKRMCSLRERDMRESPISEQNAKADVNKMYSERESNF